MLTRESILALKPCRRTNWLIHMEVMGNKAWKYKIRVENSYQTHIKFQPEKPTWPDEVYTEITFEEIEEGRIIVQDVPDYSGDISAAWKMEEKMNTDENFWRYANWVKKILLRNNENGVNEFDMLHASALTRCRAALLTTISGEDTK